MADHGTVECYDGGCRKPVCVHAQQVRVAKVRRERFETIAAGLTPPAPQDPPSDEPSNDQPADEQAP
jgi:hypothetical protein